MLRRKKKAKVTQMSVSASPAPSTPARLLLRSGWCCWTLSAVLAGVALLATVGGDARWVGALGRAFATGRADVPFVAEPTAGVLSVTRLAQLLAAPLGDRGLLLAQVAGVAVALGLLVVQARRSGAADRATAGVLLLVALGAAGALFVIRLQLVSLPLFAALVLLLRSERRGALWCAVPVLALWSNLHGGALIGLALLVVRVSVPLLRRPRLCGRRVLGALGLLLAGAAALCATPALAATPAYYHQVLTGELARRGQGLWSPLDLHSAPHLLLLGVVALLAPLVLRARPPAWELVALVGVAVATLLTARNGTWLLLLMLGPASQGAGPIADPQVREPVARRWAIAPVGLLAVAVVVATVRGPVPTGAEPALVAAAVSLAAGSAVAATGQAAEQVAAAGGCLWVANPLDAFARDVQARYLDWSDGGPTSLLPPGVGVALVSRGSAADQVLDAAPGWSRAQAGPRSSLHVRAVGTPPLTCPR